MIAMRAMACPTRLLIALETGEHGPLLKAESIRPRK